MKKSSRSKTLIDFLIICVVICLAASIVFAGAGCKKSKTAVAEDSTGLSQDATAETAGTDGKEKESTPESSTAAQSSEQQDDTDISSSTSSAETATEPTEGIPEVITELIETADNYYFDKEYGLAKNAYRKAEIAIDESELSFQKKEELKESFFPEYEESKKIIETARMHFTNAKQLEYEQRYEEALTELEAAIGIYPKYEEALEAYENLKTLMGLQ